MYRDVNSWVAQADWLFSKIDPDACGKHGPETLREILVSVQTGGIEMNEGYLALKTSGYSWIIRRWVETKGSDDRLPDSDCNSPVRPSPPPRGALVFPGFGLDELRPCSPG